MGNVEGLADPCWALDTVQKYTNLSAPKSAHDLFSKMGYAVDHGQMQGLRILHKSPALVWSAGQASHAVNMWISDNAGGQFLVKATRASDEAIKLLILIFCSMIMSLLIMIIYSECSEYIERALLNNEN